MSLHHLEAPSQVQIFQRSDAGCKAENQDAIGARLPTGSLLTTKGIAFVIADGVSAAEAAQEASQASVTGFLTDYFSTPDTWSVKKSALKVLQSLNRWLYGQSQSHIQGRGFLTTLSVLVIKSNVAHVFHVGDSRIYRLRDEKLEPLTRDHKQHLSGQQYHLTRAMGGDLSLDIDYRIEEVQQGDQFLLTTDGIHDVLSDKDIQRICTENALADVPNLLFDAALAKGSQDNISSQIVRIDELQSVTDPAVYQALNELPFPPDLSVGQTLDNYKVIRLLQASQRSQLYVVEDELGQRFVMKTPSRNYLDDLAYIERFVLEEWIGSRVHSPNIVRTITPKSRRFLYYLTQYVPGPTLEEVLKQRGVLEISDAIDITEQLAKALRALHRKETLHQDLKPANIIISKQGAVLIDFGSCFVAGINEIKTSFEREIALGTAEYSAPEYRYGGQRSEQSDQFSLAVVLYEMLTGKQPYGDKYQLANSQKDFQKLTYHSACVHNPMVPTWLDGTLEKALSIPSATRFASLSEFIFELKNPNTSYHNQHSRPWLESKPERVWQAISALLAATVVGLIAYIAHL